MNKQQHTALNMPRFIKSPCLTLLEKLDALVADEHAATCERSHDSAQTPQNRLQLRRKVEREGGAQRTGRGG
ncbi:Rop family plasmid primer RNA-binding protein [Salmonella enterica]|uniref:Rop family plasmid primer RNA-binding protein n=1 Tax=Salmonella enterica TaxID=28901 RepID=UPI00398C4F46